MEQTPEHEADLAVETWLIAKGRPTQPGQPLNTPPVLASNFRLPGDRYYNRIEGTETQEAFEALIGGIEGGRSLAFGSGMAAVSAVFSTLPVGSIIVLPNDPYHATGGLADLGEQQGRWTVERIDLQDTSGWVEAASRADLLWIESPANPLLTVADLPTICRADRKPGCVIAVDSTFATPIVQRPLSMGADISMHSATKFIGGHSDLLAGVLTVKDDALADKLLHARLLHGATIGAMEAFLAIRGARTLALRMERSMQNAMDLADRLEQHDAVTRVRYPGLPSHDTFDVATSFMNGYGAMMSFEVSGTAERAAEVVEGSSLIKHATSLGGIESTWERRAAIAGQETMPPTLIRFSVGCENVEDLWRDISQCLATTK